MCCVATSDPRCFFLVTMYGTTHAHLVHMCLHRWRVPQFALKYPCNLPPPPRRPSLGDRLPAPHPGDRRALTREFARGGQGTWYALVPRRVSGWSGVGDNPPLPQGGGEPSSLGGGGHGGGGGAHMSLPKSLLSKLKFGSKATLTVC